MSNAAGDDVVILAKDQRILRSLLFGQYGNLFKFALWWISLAPLTIALIGTSTAVGVSRIVYNASLSLCAPLGPIICSRFGPRRSLLTGVLVRFVVWCLALPALWTALYEEGSVVHVAVYVVFCIMIFVDGVAVAITSFLDIDMCGVDAVAGAYDLPVDDDSRNYFNSRNELFFAACFILFAPLMSWGVLIYKPLFTNLVGPAFSSSASLSAMFAATFLIASSVQLFFFLRLPPPAKDAAPPTDLGLPLNGDAPSDEEEQQPAEQSLVTVSASAFDDLRAGMGILCNNSPVFFRILFLALEISVEDALIVVVASHCGLMLPWQGAGEAVEGNIWTAMGVAVGKLGALLASFLMLKYFKPPQTNAGYWKLFLAVAAASMASFGIAGAVTLREQGLINDNEARGIYFASMFAFFFLSTLPKIGFQSLLQGMVASIPNGHLVFGLIAIFFTVTDSGIIMALTIVFEKFTMEVALWITCSFLMLHGLVELSLGPWLVLRDPGEDVGNAAETSSVTTTRSLQTVTDPTSLLREE